jgi:Spx/MgsR family transcriptional regulator
MAMITLYGIPNCGTVKKARQWLDARGVAYRFHDFRKDGVDEKRLRSWVDELGWEAVLNRRGTTWRAAPDALKAKVDAPAAIRFMLEQPSAIKRPVLDLGRQRLVGFDETQYLSVLGGG